MISLIVAYDKNRCIGSNNTIPWNLKEDMKRVKSLTTNQTILMGRKTYESIGKPLPNRINRVLTNNSDYVAEGIELFSNIDDALRNVTTEKIFIFGGSTIYEQLIDVCNEIYITEVDADINGDSYFPKLKEEEWLLISEESFKKDINNEYDYKFLYYRKKEV
ncbi:dihydrofolate reductase [Gemella sp. GH3]|uniref:dihydrofolate reductase n=1 Tax=unclassified Gemella TaxID=2624949 RepID=UPI0015D08D4A|nr:MULTISPECIES: dihydrofolate reductase [unclassified Gemella]MBF0713214.1 dihydrofolate reductase [Gemella sp. GH3.1]NYS50166.1 dihydrofolate reductase [Gemella sp. GH3]